MKSKTIKKVLKSKLKDWIDSIEDEKVKKLVKKNTIVTGGSIASMLLGEKVKDFDVYFKNKETVLAVARYYVDQFNENTKHSAEVLDCDNDGTIKENEPGRVKILVQSQGVASESPETLDKPFEDVYDVLEDADSISEDALEDGEKETKKKYRPVFLSSNAITLAGKIQLVIRFYGEPKEIHENYDFAHCMNYYEYDSNTLTLVPEALECLLTKELRYKGSKYPLCSIIRTRKFIQRGFSVNAGQYLKMMMQLNDLDLTDIQVLEDQLIGVDSSFFAMLIDGLKKKQESDSSFVVTESYVASIIDKIF